MSKHRLSPIPEPPAKRQHTLSSSPIARLQLTFDSALYDELILSIFAHLSWADLCVVQRTNKNWARLSSDNQLWKSLYFGEYGRGRLRGARGFIGRNDGREIRPLPGRANLKGKEKDPQDGVKDWKWMFRISSNWRTGRCAVEELHNIPEVIASPSESNESYLHEQEHILLAGNLTIRASSRASRHPPIYLRAATGQMHTLLANSPSREGPTQITALALDQSPPSSSSSNLGLACFISTGEFTIYSINHTTPSLSSPKLTYVPVTPNTRVTPIIQAVYHHPLLITLSEAFHLSLYDLSGDSVAHLQTLTSFTSHPPSSLVLSATAGRDYKLVLAYAVAVYPAHWSVGATELIISGISSPAHSLSLSTIKSDLDPPLTVLATRTTRAFEVPNGWIDEKKLRTMREQWGRKVQKVADTQTDGKWVIIAPDERSVSRTRYSPTPSSSSSNSGASSSLSSPEPLSQLSSTYLSNLHSPTHLQLYRLHFPSSNSATTPPKLTFVRTLHGQSGSISSLALADGRCVSLSLNGSIWVWDLESGGGAEVAAACDIDLEGDEAVESRTSGKNTVVFDERRIISAGRRGLQIRRFDI